MSYDKNILKKKNKSRTFDTEPNLYLFVYTSMLILNFHLIEINNWQHLLQQGLFWQNFISPIYMCRYISHCLASPHLAKKPFVLCIAKTAAPLAIEPFVARHPSINQILCSPCKAPQGSSLPYHDSVYWSHGLSIPWPGSVCTYVSQLSINGTNKVSQFTELQNPSLINITLIISEANDSH